MLEREQTSCNTAIKLTLQTRRLSMEVLLLSADAAEGKNLHLKAARWMEAFTGEVECKMRLRLHNKVSRRKGKVSDSTRYIKSPPGGHSREKSFLSRAFRWHRVEPLIITEWLNCVCMSRSKFQCENEMKIKSWASSAGELSPEKPSGKKQLRDELQVASRHEDCQQLSAKLLEEFQRQTKFDEGCKLCQQWANLPAGENFYRMRTLALVPCTAWTDRN